MMTNFSFTSTQLLAVLGSISLVILASIWIGRLYFRRQAARNLSQQRQSTKKQSPLQARNKYPEMDVFKLRGIIILASVAFSLLLITGAFNWTQTEPTVQSFDGMMEMEVDIEVAPPRSAAPPPPPPPPPPSMIKEVPEELILEDDEVEFVDQSVTEETFVDAPPAPKPKKASASPPPPPPPPPKEDNVKEIFKIVEQMPRFPGCEDLAGTDNEKMTCANQKLLEFLYQNIEYPRMAQENNIQGTVVVTFVVNMDGSITDAEVLRDIGGGCGAEALRVINLMKEMDEKWTPGRQRGHAVPVQFSLPVRFRLEEL